VSEVTSLSEQAGRFKTGAHAAPATTTASRNAASARKAYTSPVKPLPAAAIPALVRAGANEDWNAF
jgi:methyl-accepting chemotaxis protein